MKRLLEGYAKDAAARKRSTENDLANNLSNVKRYPGYDGVMKADPRGAPSSSSLSPSASTLQMMDAHEGPPHFLVIGAQKAGTMAVVKNLNKHPEICCLSEEHYFDLGYRSKSLNSYRSLFQKAPGSAPEKRILGDKTPEYGYVEDCHSRIKAACGQETKFIMMIRDPVERAYSAWNMNIKRNFEVNLFDECVEKNFKNLNEHRSYGTAEYHYVQRGFYLDQILRFLETFPNRYFMICYCNLVHLY